MWKWTLERVTEELKTSLVHILYDETKPYKDELPKQIVLHKNFGRLLQRLKKSMLKLDFPTFAPIFDYMDVSKVNNLYYYLKGFLSFTNRQQAKKDLLEIGRKLFSKKDRLDEFDDTYDHYDMRAILRWYTENSFLHKIINNCLRISTPDSILYCRAHHQRSPDCHQRELSNRKKKSMLGLYIEVVTYLTKNGRVWMINVVKI